MRRPPFPEEEEEEDPPNGNQSNNDEATSRVEQQVEQVEQVAAANVTPMRASDLAAAASAVAHGKRRGEDEGEGHETSNSFSFKSGHPSAQSTVPPQVSQRHQPSAMDVPHIASVALLVPWNRRSAYKLTALTSLHEASTRIFDAYFGEGNGNRSVSFSPSHHDATMTDVALLSQETNRQTRQSKARLRTALLRLLAGGGGGQEGHAGGTMSDDDVDEHHHHDGSKFSRHREAPRSNARSLSPSLQAVQAAAALRDQLTEKKVSFEHFLCVHDVPINALGSRTGDAVLGEKVKAPAAAAAERVAIMTILTVIYREKTVRDAVAILSTFHRKPVAATTDAPPPSSSAGAVMQAPPPPLPLLIAGALMMDSIGVMSKDVSDYSPHLDDLLPSLSMPKIGTASKAHSIPIHRVLWNTENWQGRGREWSSKYRTRWLNRTLVERRQEGKTHRHNNNALPEGAVSSFEMNTQFWSKFDVISSFESTFPPLPAAISTTTTSIPYGHMFDTYERDYASLRKAIPPPPPSTTRGPSTTGATSNKPYPFALNVAGNCHTEYALPATLREWRQTNNVNGSAGSAGNDVVSDDGGRQRASFREGFLRLAAHPPHLRGKMPKDRLEFVASLNNENGDKDDAGIHHTLQLGLCGGHVAGSPEAEMKLFGCGDTKAFQTALEALYRGKLSERTLRHKARTLLSSSSDSLTLTLTAAYSPASLRKGCLMRRHLFYLSFENSNTPDYVTEKLYEPLAAGTIPVYYGAPNVALFAPAPHSLIDASAFNDVATLRAYLVCVANNASLLAYYRAWRERRYKHYSPKGGHCPLCDIVHALLSHPQSTRASSTSQPAPRDADRQYRSRRYRDQEPLPCGKWAG